MKIGLLSHFHILHDFQTHVIKLGGEIFGNKQMIITIITKRNFAIKWKQQPENEMIFLNFLV